MQKEFLKKLKRINASKASIGLFPGTPGIYIFWGDNRPIYIGKAINLKSRLESYFSLNLAPKTSNMVNDAKTISFVQVESEIEALLLEANLIKDYQPKYNFISKDDKHPLYIKITKEDFPRVLTARKYETNGSLAFFGPFPSSPKVYLVLKMLRKIFPYSTHKLGKKACIYNQIGLCNPCPNLINQINDPKQKKQLTKDYQDNIKKLNKILFGGIKNIVKELNQEMVNYSKSEEFEKAGKTKIQLESLKYITQQIVENDKFLSNPNLLEDIRAEELKDLEKILFSITGKEINLNKIECFDVSHISGYLATASLVTFVKAEANKSEYKRFRIRQTKSIDDISSLTEVAQRRLNNIKSWGKPDLIIVDGGIGQVKTFLKVFDNQQIPIIGLAKQFETLIIPIHKNNQTVFKKYVLKNTPAKNLVQRIRDESHRFAQKYHNLLVKKDLLKK